MSEASCPRNFDQDVLPHLNAAYNLARWLTRNDQDAEDVVQEAYLRAFRYFEGFRGGNARAWLLKIVRNTFHNRLTQSGRLEATTAFDEEVHSDRCSSPSPETLLLQSADGQLLRQALEALPLQYRELLILRELEDLSYAEIADAANIPMGTVMSSLSRARERLRKSLAALQRAHSNDSSGNRVGCR
jgi:RNA polymerase sigma-70 factor (ECF subfamily)